ncbi:unnamed protein product [Trichobilharzia szidati]|nr:unnamed protein product [Trichobilharzia szidati]
MAIINSVMDQKLMPFGIESNFWRASQSSGGGLCGPSTEVHIDFKALTGGDQLDCARCLVNTVSPQVVELWNCVFITHRILPNNENNNNNSSAAEDHIKPEQLVPLAKTFVDTGMGLERLACVMQGITSNYDSHDFHELMEFIHSKANSSGQSIVPEYQGLFFLSNQQELLEKTHTSESLQKEGGDQSANAFTSLWHTLSHISSPSTSSALCSKSHLASDQSWKDRHNGQNDLLDVWHRDTAYRILVDHSRAIAFALADGLLPGRQGLSLKIRQLMYRAFRASALTGLDNCLVGDRNSSEKVKSLLGALVCQVAKQHVHRLHAYFNSMNAVRGPNSSGNSDGLTPEQMESVVNEELTSFAPRLLQMEQSFNRCLEECNNEIQLSTEQVMKLMNGEYGYHLSWDMICAQSRWAGLLPPLPLSTEGKSSHDQSKLSTFKRFKASNAASVISRQLHNSNVPFTNDSLKYNFQRKSDSVVSCTNSQYDFPDCQTHLLGVLIPSGEAYTLITNQTDLSSYLEKLSTEIQESSTHSNITSKDSIGFIFEQTNFFTSSGGQDSDTGFIYSPSKIHQFQVNETTFLTDNTSSNSQTDGWVIHWCQRPSSAVLTTDLSSNLCFNQPFTLSIDKERRYNLMCSHTGQHLFATALESLVALSDNSKMSTFQHHGGASHPSYFTLKAAFVGPAADQMNENLGGFIQRLEELCRELIQKHIPISVWNTDVSKATKIKEVRYFPWEEYTEKVRTVCIGQVKPTSSDGHADESVDFTSVISAELCCGTHLSQLSDLQDIAVIAVKGRQSTIKEFTCIFGHLAKSAHQRANTLIKEGELRQKQALNNPQETVEHIKWFEGILNDSHQQHQCGYLPLYARLALESNLHRIHNKIGNDGDAGDVIDGVQIQLHVDNLRDLISRNKSRISDVIVSGFTFNKPDELVLAFQQLKPSQSFVVYHKNVAVCYFPSLQFSQTALNIAHQLAKQLSDEQSVATRHLYVKGRPLRSSHLMMHSNNDTDRYKYACLQLLPTSSANTTTTTATTTTTGDEVAPMNPSDWKQYHDLLCDCVNSVQMNYSNEG